MSLAAGDPAHAEAFQAHERFLWGLSYRMTGCAADADDVVQEAFVRALQQTPSGDSASWRPWLVRVAMNVSRDILRRRKRRGYVGPWLPSPIETGDEESLPAYEVVTPGPFTTEGRYDLLESVSFAFLLALEALTPRQRAVLLLMDVFDYSVQETAAALDMSSSNVKVTHHRARKALHYDRERRPPIRELQEQTRATLGRFVAALNEQDVGAVESLLAESVRSLSDGGGEFFAARVPIDGPRRVGRFFWNINQRRARGSVFEVRMLNGLPALLGTFGKGHRGEPPHTVVQCEIDPSGRIVRLYAVLATRKLTAVQLPSVG